MIDSRFAFTAQPIPRTASVADPDPVPFDPWIRNPEPGWKNPDPGYGMNFLNLFLELSRVSSDFWIKNSWMQIRIGSRDGKSRIRDNPDPQH